MAVTKTKKLKKTKMTMRGEIEIKEDGKSVEVEEDTCGGGPSGGAADFYAANADGIPTGMAVHDGVEGTEDRGAEDMGGADVSDTDGCAPKLPDDDDEPCYDDPRELGRRGELAAGKYLRRRGIEILERNWRCRYGEADIIALDDETIVFIEVKTRRGIDKGIPEEAVTPGKRDRYEKIAASYLEQNDFVDCFVRFDVIAIMAVSNTRAFLRHHRGAFAHGD